jgi:predicted porin
LLDVQGLCAEDSVSDQQGSGASAEQTDDASKAENTQKRELGADEDPLAKEQAKSVKERAEGVVQRSKLQLYGSIRIRYRQINSESTWSDGGSRIGLNGSWPVTPKIRIFGRGEAGINLLDEFDFLLNRGDRPQGENFSDSAFVRLLYAGVETSDVTLTAGKNWSTYYRVSGFTDRFQGTGASASGTYNAGTDGGYTGTGRADGVLQVRGSVGKLRLEQLLRPLRLNFQIQDGEPIPTVPDKNYETTVGVSSVYEAGNHWSIGVAYNHANIDDADVIALRPIGIDGDATALVVGARWYGDRWYVGTVVSRLENHEATDEDIYFDGTGWEVYSQYKLAGPWWAIAGWNKLRPDAGQVQAGSYSIDYGVLGIRYVFQEMRKMIFANVRFDSGSTQDGQPLSNVYTIGVRWDLP